MAFFKNMFREKGTSSTFTDVDPSKSPQKDVEMDNLAEENINKLKDLLSSDVSNQLMDYFEFESDQKRRVRRSEQLVYVFLLELREQRIIKPHNVIPLVNGLRYLRQHALAWKVDQIFRLSTGINNRLHGLTNDLIFGSLVDTLRRNYRTQCKAVKPFIGLQEPCFIDDIFVEGKIEMLIANTGVGSRENWKELGTHHDVVTIASKYDGSISIEGNTGYGKSMLMLQLAHEWCEAKGTSPMSKLDLLIFLQCEKVCKDGTIYQSIRNMIPESSALSTDEISNIIHSCSSIMIILDDVDKLIKGTNMELSNFIGSGATSTKFSVVMTSQPGKLPSYNPGETKRIRLCGFDSRAKQHYVRKVLARNNDSLSEDTLKKIGANVALDNLCEIPSLFSSFARIATQSNYPHNAHTMTSVFRRMPLYLGSNCTLSEYGIESRPTDTNYSENHIRLSKVAYDTLTKRKETMLWRKQELIKVLGEECYQILTNSGILREQQTFLSKTDCQPPDFDTSTWSTDVRFCHDIFCEWYAACHIEELVRNSAPLTYLTSISPVKFANVFRFFCGLNTLCASEVIKYLETAGEAGVTFGLLCRLEQLGNFDYIKNEVRNICANGVTFTKDGSRLMQNSMIEILELASKQEISVTLLSLRNCINFDRSCGGRLVLYSDSVLSSHTLKAVETLQITEQVRMLDYQQVKDIMNFAKQGFGLKVLRFIECLPPWMFDSMDLSQGPSLARYNFQVQWISKMNNTYQLNKMSGKWEKDGMELQAVDYNREVHYFEMNLHNATSSDNKTLVTDTSPVSRKRPCTSTSSHDSDQPN